MAKRFIDTDLFKKPFMRSLEAPYKALWVYLLCECDHAGIWSVELDVAQLRMGMKLDPEKALEKMGGAVVSIEGGTKWYLPDFIAFQYGTLNPANRVHESVLALLSKHGIDPNEEQEKKGLVSPLQGAKDKDKDKDKVKDLDLDLEGVQGKPKGPDPDVQGVVGYLIERLRAEGVAQSLDGDQTGNRYAARSLILKLRKDYPGHDALASSRALIDAAMSDPFHRRNSTTVRYLLNNCGKIAANFKQANDPKQSPGANRQTDPGVAAANAEEYFARKRERGQAESTGSAQPQGANNADRAA